MQPIPSVIALPLYWAVTFDSPGMYELKSGEMILARLRKVTTRIAAGQTAHSMWTMAWANWPARRLHISPHEPGGISASFTPSWFGASSPLGGGVLVCDHGHAYRWKRDGGSQYAATFRGSGGSATVRFRDGGRVEIASTTEHPEDLPILLLVGWYLMLKVFEDEVVVIN